MPAPGKRAPRPSTLREMLAGPNDANADGDDDALAGGPGNPDAAIEAKAMGKARMPAPRPLLKQRVK